MKTTTYTQIVLTIIAVNLTFATLKDVELIPTAHATASETSLPTTNYGLVPLNEDGSITVTLGDANELDVVITGIETSDELDVNLDEIGGGYVSHGGPIRVKTD